MKTAFVPNSLIQSHSHDICYNNIYVSICQVLLLYFFQFLTFAERLANVNIDVIHRIDRTGAYAEVCIFWHRNEISWGFFWLHE